MPEVDPLADARAKLGRAKFHTETLRADIREAGQGEPYTIPLREELDQDTGLLYLRVDRETARPEYWGLLIGDALHNLRSALESGWWQLACHHLRRKPTEEEAQHVQFPILKSGGTWNPGSVKKWVGPTATKFAEALQPDPGGYPPNVFHPLAALRQLSNIDKHRNIHTTVQRLHELRLQFTGDLPDAPSIDLGISITYLDARAPKAGDELLSIPADAWARQPELQFKAHQSGFVAFEGRRMSVVNTLYAIGAFVDSTLVGFAHILAGKDPGTPRLASRKLPRP